MIKHTASPASVHKTLPALPKRPHRIKILLLSLVLVVGAVAASAAAYVNATARGIEADVSALTLHAGETKTIHFTYRPENTDIASLACGSEQADVALMRLDAQSSNVLTCTVQAHSPGKAMVYVALDGQTKTVVAVTVTA